MNDKHFVITIERQYGSGGRLTGKRLAEELGIHFYDEEILKMTSETSAIGEQYFRLADERAGNNMLYRIVTSMISLRKFLAVYCCTIYLSVSGLKSS